MSRLFKSLMWVGALGLACAVLAGVGPSGAQSDRDNGRVEVGPASPLFDPENFRCIFVGDSQIAAPARIRLRAPMRQWDLPIAGAFIGAHHEWTGQIVDIDVKGVDLLTSKTVGNAGAWTWSGPRDFMCYRGYEWRCYGDIDEPDRPFATFQQYQSYPNLVEWDDNWLIGEELLVRIAVRTSPNGVATVETMARRGEFVDTQTRTLHHFEQIHGIQIIEQVIPAGFMPEVDGVGVSMYFPEGVVEKDRTLFQVLGVAILRVDQAYKPLPGMIVGAMAFPGWSLDEHLAVSDSSREALVKLIDANAVMIMLGHNREPSGTAHLRADYAELVDRWTRSFENTGHGFPTVFNVVPWVSGANGSLDYLEDIEAVMRETTARVGGRTVSFVEYFENEIPDAFNPRMYQLDQNRVHPDNPDTALHLSEDLEAILLGNKFEDVGEFSNQGATQWTVKEQPSTAEPLP